MLCFSRIGFYVNFDNFLLGCPILQDNFVQLISTLIKSYYHHAYFLHHYEYYMIAVPQCPSKTEQIAATENLIYDVIIALFFIII